MHSASPVSTTWICASSPSPASLAETVTVDPDVVNVGCADEVGAAGHRGRGEPEHCGGGDDGRSDEPGT
jgi:hypothetical protein